MEKEMRIMNIKKMKLPVIIIALGMILAVVSCFLTGILKEPMVKEHEFTYSVTYRLDGEVKTYEGGFSAAFAQYDEHDIPTLREYTGVHTKDEEDLSSFWFPIAYKNGVELSLVVELDAAYLMGDPDKFEYDPGNEDPYLAAVDEEGYAFDVAELFGAEIISWDYPEPIENSFKFAGFSILYAGSMAAMILVAFLTVIACMIFVKKDATVEYSVLDKLSVIANWIMSIAGIPFMTLIIFILPLTMDSGSLTYQIYLCIPALTAFTVAASVALRRKGFTKTGLLVQFVFPVLFFAEMFVEALIYNLFF